ncbi:putative serine/threonine-protein kinase mkcF [Varanus komodoensis]|nr:putative serine/threonine-protein kinase mkcF [Varanus komodoensis]
MFVVVSFPNMNTAIVQALLSSSDKTEAIIISLSQLSPESISCSKRLLHISSPCREINLLLQAKELPILRKAEGKFAEDSIKDISIHLKIFIRHLMIVFSREFCLLMMCPKYHSLSFVILLLRKALVFAKLSSSTMFQMHPFSSCQFSSLSSFHSHTERSGIQNGLLAFFPNKISSFSSHFFRLTVKKIEMPLLRLSHWQ